MEEEKKNVYNDDDRHYLQMMQGNIERMVSIQPLFRWSKI